MTAAPFSPLPNQADNEDERAILRDSHALPDDPITTRPRSLDEFIGQERVRENLSIFVQAANKRKEALDHVLLAGPPGLGKTSLAHIIAKERGASLRVSSGPALQKPGDIAAILSGLEPYDILFIDEIHRLNLQVEEILYPALEDYNLDVMIGSGVGARSVRVALNPFTLVGATTRSGLLSAPLRDRFGIILRLDFYDHKELSQIIERAASIFNMTMSAKAINELARRARGTPRIAERLLKRVRDFLSMDAPSQNRDSDERGGVAEILSALRRLGIDDKGLDRLDHHYLRCLTQTLDNRPIGIETLAASLGETRDVLEDMIEPFLLREGFIIRTPRGRVATAQSYHHLGLPAPTQSASHEEQPRDQPRDQQGDLFHADKANDKEKKRGAD